MIPADREMLLAAFENADIGLCLVAPDDRVILANRQWLEATGLSGAQAIGQSLLDLFPETRELTASIHARARAGERVAVPRHSQHLNGRETWWEDTVTPVPMRGGVATLITAHDVTGQVLARRQVDRLLAELSAERARWQATVESMLDPVTVSDAEGHAIYMNEAYFRMLGIPISPGLPVSEHPRYYRLYHPDGTPFAAEDLPLQRAALHNVQVRGVEIVHRRRDGREFTAVFNAAPVYDENGRLVGAVAVGRDVTELRRAQREAERRAAELNALFQAVTEPVLVWDEHGTIQQTNPAGQALYGLDPTGLSREELAQRLRMRHPDGRPLAVEEMPVSRILRGEAVAGQRVAFTDARGREVQVVITGAPLTGDGALRGVVVVWHDITEEERLLAEVQRLLSAERRARQDAEEALRLRDEFLSVAAHELKTPVTSLRGYAELTLRRLERHGLPDPPQLFRAMQVIERQASRLGNLVNQLLDISRVEAGAMGIERQETDVAALTRAVVETLQAGATAHELVLRAPASLPALVDPPRLEQVILNLIENAIAFSPEGTQVEIDLSTPEPDTLRFAVRDHGPGVPPEQREKLFTRYFRAGTRRPAGGLGLGLYVSRRIVELHGGQIWAEFPEDGGSRFVVVLPRGTP